MFFTPVAKTSFSKWLFLCFCSTLLFSMPASQCFAEKLKIGVYNNNPLVFQDEKGEFQGLTIDVLRYIAKKEDWTLEYTSGSWPECLQRLETGETDLQVAIAFSATRANIYSFPEETLITNWGRLYRHPDTTAESLLDLDNKTVALLEKDIHAKVFTDLMEKFSKETKTVYLSSYDEILQQVEAGTVDIGVVNRMYAMQNAHRFQVEATPMIFNPIEVRYAAPKGKHSELLQTIDKHLKLLRENKNSVYYQSLEKWFGHEPSTKVPKWIKPTLLTGSGLLLFILILSLLLKKQVAIKTKDMQTIFDSSPSAIIIHEMDGKIVDLNQTMLEMFGVSKEEGLNMSIIADFSSPENPLDMLPDLWKNVSEGKAQELEWIARRPHDESTFTVLVNLENILYDGREVIYATIQDISAKKEAEKRLASEQERLAVTLRSIGDGVIATDTESKVIFINKVAEKLTGWSSKEAKGRASQEIFNIINEKTGQKCVSPVQRVLELGRIVGLANHTALIAKDGTLRSIADSGAPIRDEQSKVVGVVLVFRDVSHEQKMEEELLKIRKLESIGVLAGGIAHDFNNILAAILGNIELATFHIAKEDLKAFTLLTDAKKATKRATKLTQQLLTFAKGGEPVREETNLAELITESTDFILHGSHIGCNYEFPDDLWKVDIDSGQISQVIQNIILNAKHAMPEGGTIAIRCDNVRDAASESLLSLDQGDYVRITLQDTGIGIPGEIIDKIFDPYFSTKQEGSGLGLAICHSIINKHEGYLTVDSISGKGTTFTIYLPAVYLPNAPVTNKPVISPPVKAAKIMIMDDETMLLNVAQAQLDVLGHEAVLVTDGTQAINRYQELQDQGSPVDLVIMDLTIPGGMGGQEAAEKLLQIDPRAKIIVASGYSNDPVMAGYDQYGFRAAIAKPFDLNELSQAITSVLRG